MTNYELTMFNNFDTLIEVGRWLRIKQDRIDLQAFVATIKKIIDMSADFEFSNDYTLFRRVLPFNSILHEFNKPHDFIPDIIAMHKEQTEQLNIKYPKQSWKRQNQ